MRFYIYAITATLILSGCVTNLPQSATCTERWEAYANDKMFGSAAGGLLGGSISGNKPTCSPG